MKTRRLKTIRIFLLLAASLGLASCEDPQVYGSVGFSTYSGGGYYGGGPRIGTSISVGGRIR
jgi:hypothetical protein